MVGVIIYLACFGFNLSFTDNPDVLEWHKWLCILLGPVTTGFFIGQSINKYLRS